MKAAVVRGDTVILQVSTYFYLISSSELTFNYLSDLGKKKILGIL